MTTITGDADADMITDGGNDTLNGGDGINNFTCGAGPDLLDSGNDAEPISSNAGAGTANMTTVQVKDGADQTYIITAGSGAVVPSDSSVNLTFSVVQDGYITITTDTFVNQAGFFNASGSFNTDTIISFTANNSLEGIDIESSFGEASSGTLGFADSVDLDASLSTNGMITIRLVEFDRPPDQPTGTAFRGSEVGPRIVVPLTEEDDNMRESQPVRPSEFPLDTNSETLLRAIENASTQVWNSEMRAYAESLAQDIDVGNAFLRRAGIIDDSGKLASQYR